VKDANCRVLVGRKSTSLKIDFLSHETRHAARGADAHQKSYVCDYREQSYVMRYWLAITTLFCRATHIASNYLDASVRSRSELAQARFTSHRLFFGVYWFYFLSFFLFVLFFIIFSIFYGSCALIRIKMIFLLLIRIIRRALGRAKKGNQQKGTQCAFELRGKVDLAESVVVYPLPPWSPFMTLELLNKLMLFSNDPVVILFYLLRKHPH